MSNDKILMKRRNTLLSLLLFALVSLSHATVYETISAGNWNSPIWTPSIPNETIDAGDTVLIHHSVALSDDLEISGYLEVTSSTAILSSTKEITVEYGGEFVNYGRVIALSEELHVDGFVYNYNLMAFDEVHNDGYICNAESLLVGDNFNLHGGTLECGGTTLTCEMKVHDNGGLGLTATLQDQNVCCPSGASDLEIDFDSGVIDSSTVFYCNVSLPVEILDFSAKTQSQGVLLYWATASEQNAEKIVIERSVDDVVFEEIGEVAAKGMASEYNFVDPEKATSTHYYRLKFIDFDGATAYSKVKSVNGGNLAAIDLSVYPNPAQGGNIHLHIDSPIEAVLKVQVFDLSGKQVLAKNISAQADNIIDHSLSSGTYLLTVTTAKITYRQRLLIY